VAHRFSHAARALRHRNFRLFATGQSLSLIGTWMTRLATTWLVYRLTASSLLVGVVAFAGLFPTFALAPFAGVWMDRVDRRALLVWTQVAAAVQSLLMAALPLAGVVTIGQILVLAAFQGVINAFDMPARQSFLVHMVEDRHDLSNAIAINSSTVHGAVRKRVTICPRVLSKNRLSKVIPSIQATDSNAFLKKTQKIK
jgi:MFS family permease